ncbi:MAG: hypothetical protein HC906_14465 [Bacteroidales bacterium]|nr:hypothetical protein [Bacteroidales bacterium]
MAGDDHPEIYEAISKYELYLRVHTAFLRLIGFPNSFFTLGSCFAVKAKSYTEIGGMNKRHAGEDFYFA